MPPKKARPRPITWKVTGGAQSGGLIVRHGPETKSAECSERLATGSVIQELEAQGERIRYKLVSGSGPETGWIGTKFKGKDLLTKRPLKAWIVATGTRGDIQPYLALACGMQTAGYDMTIWTCEDYRSFVETYGIRMHSIAGSIEEKIKGTFNSRPKEKEKKGKDGKDGAKSKDSGKSAGESDAATEGSKYLMRVNALWFLSLACQVPSVGGISSTKMLPKEVEEKLTKAQLSFFYEMNAGILASPAVGRYDTAEMYHNEALRLQPLAEEEEEQKRLASKSALADGLGPEAEPDASPRSDAPPPPDLSRHVPWHDAFGEPDWEVLGRRCAEDPESAVATISAWADWDNNKDQSYAMVKTYCDLHSYWTKDRLLNQSDMELAAGIEGLFMSDLASREDNMLDFRAEIERNPPDICLYNIFWFVAAMQVEAKCSCPTILLHLQPAGIDFSDPHAPWITEEAWPLVQKLNPELYNYSSMHEARQHHVNKDWVDFGAWARAVVIEQEVFEPYFRSHPIRDMGPLTFNRRNKERPLVGFLSSITSDRFLPYMGEWSKHLVETYKIKYTGFWIMDDKAQTGGASSSMFGGPELMKKVEDFIAAGDKPAYIGWGSCVGSRGRYWMIALAVTALKKANMRGIILGGWAELNMDCLIDLVGDEDSLGLVEYAKRNVLFIEKAPQVWLFPKCSVVVIHGGVGTLAAAWTSGTPLVICPVWLDQFGNQWLNTLMGTADLCQRVDDCTPEELAYHLKTAATDPAKKRGAEAVQFSMMMDRGVQTAMEHIDDVILEEVPSGRWHAWWS